MSPELARLGGKPPVWGFRAVRRASGLCAVLLLASAPARGADEVALSGEDLLRRAEATYNSLTSFHFVAKEVTETRSSRGQRSAETYYLTARGAKGRSRVEIRGQSKSGLAVFDGRSNWVYLPGVKQFTRQSSGSILGSPSAPRIFDGVNFARYVERYPARYEALSRNLVSATIVRREALDGETRPGTYAVVEARYKLPAGAPWGQSKRTFWIDERGFLIAREISRAIAKAPGLKHPLEIIQTVSFATARADEELPDSLFVFVPPEDAEQVPTFNPQARRSPTFLGQSAHDFSLQDLKGRTFRLRNLRGKIVLLDFWASWCGPCRIDLPHIEALHDEYTREELVVLGVNGESETAARSFMEQQGYSFPSLVDQGHEVSRQYQATSLPTIVIVDEEGDIAAYLVGLQSESALRGALAKAGLP